MQFNLKNIIKNLLAIYDNISIEGKNLSEKKIHNKKLNILVKKFKEYLSQDIESAKAYLELMQIEYFLLTEFNDLANEEFDIEALLYTFDNFTNDINGTLEYFFDMGYLKILLDEIINAYKYSRYYDYTALITALNDPKLSSIIKELHPNIKSEEQEIASQKQTNAYASVFLNNKNTTPFEFFTYLKYLYSKYHDKDIVREYGEEKLRKLKNDDEEAYKKIMAFLIRTFYYYFSSSRKEYYLKTSCVNELDATDLLDFIDASKDMEYLIKQIGIDYYLDNLLDTVFIYNVESYNEIASSLTEKQKLVLKKLGGK